MNPKLRRFFPPLWLIVTLAALAIWNWSFDHLPEWAALLVLLGILGGFWVVGRFVQHRREARETHSAEATNSE